MDNQTSLSEVRYVSELENPKKGLKQFEPVVSVPVNYVSELENPKKGLKPRYNDTRRHRA